MNTSLNFFCTDSAAHYELLYLYNLKCKTWLGLKHFLFFLSGQKVGFTSYIKIGFFYNPKAAEQILLNPNSLSSMESYVIKVSVTGINGSTITEFL